MKLPVVLTQGEDGYIIAEVPTLPGCFSQGKTREEALSNVTEASLLCLEGLASEGTPIPSEQAELTEIAV